MYAIITRPGLPDKPVQPRDLERTGEFLDDPAFAEAREFWSRVRETPA